MKKTYKTHKSLAIICWTKILAHLGLLALSFPSGQHITTFDLHHYQFLGPCSYLLTRDFVGGDFSVVGVYQAEAGVVGLASLEVRTSSGTVVLGVNGSVDTSQTQHEVTSLFCV